MTDTDGDRSDGWKIVAVARYATAGFAALSVAAAAAPGSLARPAAAVDTILFAVGCVAFLLAYTRGVRRSRTEIVSIGGLYFLTGDVAGPDVRRTLLGALAVQVVVGLGAAATRPYTVLAAGVLVPIFGLGLGGYWASRHGRFPPRGDSTSDRG